MNTRKSTKTEHNAFMKEMQGYTDNAPVKLERRNVGFFWYDPNKNELYGVQKKPIDQLKRGQQTINKLHYQYWRDQQYKPNKDPRMAGRYEDKPRGRVFVTADDRFIVCVGDWCTPEVSNKIKPLIQKEFRITDFDLVEDPHWNIGNGPSGDFLKEFSW